MRWTFPAHSWTEKNVHGNVTSFEKVLTEVIEDEEVPRK